MHVELLINDTPETGGRYVGWSPAPCSASLHDADGLTALHRVQFRNLAATGGQVVFRDPVSLRWQETLELDLPPNAAPVSFAIAGKFGFPSTRDRDAAVEAVDARTGTALATIHLMVRVRKDVNDLNVDERDRLLHALARHNTQGLFQSFREMHTAESKPQMHTLPGFLPWHRAYILDLERELQDIDPTVALPYWRFDRPAPGLFTEQFMGAPDGRRARFDPENWLDQWTTDLDRGIRRFEIGEQHIADERSILFDGRTATFERFRRLERGPHAAVHGNFEPFLGDLAQAARDPVFFLLHCNVDRLWAKWQWLHRRFDFTGRDSYDRSTSAVGHRLEDSLWPWNQTRGGPRPSTSPGGRFADSPVASAPGPIPFLHDMFDYQGVVTAAAGLAFDYADVPYQPDVGSFHDYRAEFILQGPGFQPAPAARRDELKELDLSSARAALGRLRDVSLPVDERRLAFSRVAAAEVSLNAFAEINADYRSVLRSLLRDPDEPIRLRATHTLAAMKDDVVQAQLRAELRGDVSSTLPADFAVLMLTYDVHAAHFELLRTLAWTSLNDRIRDTAIRALSQDPSSAPRLLAAMRDRREPTDIRRSAALSLDDVDRVGFRSAAVDILRDETEPRDLRVSLAIRFELIEAPELADHTVSAIVRRLMQREEP